MSIQKEIDRFFKSRNDPPVVGVSDAATLLRVDETVVRRWCREEDLHRVGPNFVLDREDVAELSAALDDEEIEDNPDSDDPDSDDPDSDDPDSDDPDSDDPDSDDPDSDDD